MSDPRRYRAFISYSHSDARVATWLHRALEGYRVPKRLRASAGEFGPLPDRLNPIFRDREELASAGDLGARVQDALSASDALIVICSPAAAGSRWVNEEVLAFKRLGRGDRIYGLIVSGEPHAGDARECFPLALRFEIEADGQLGQRPAEPIAADIRSGKDGRALALLKLIAGLLGTNLDKLRQREAQRRHRRMLAIVVASLAGMTLAIALAITALVARNDALVARNDALRRQGQAEDLLGFMLGDLRDKLEKVGRLDLLDSVYDKATGYFASLDPRDLTDTTLSRQAEALTSIGQVRLKQARYPEALASFQSAYRRSSALAARHPHDGSRLFDRGQAEYWVGNVYWQSRNLDRAQMWWTRYRDTCRAVYAIDPTKADWQHELAYGDHNLAALELERGELQGARDGFKRARGTLESVLARTPDDAKLLFEVADEVSWLGNVDEQAGRLESAEALLASKVESLSRIATSQPTDPQWKAEWSSSELLESELLRICGKYAQAETLADRAVARMQALTLHDPGNKDWSQGYLRALVLRAAARIGAGKLAQANADLALAQPLIDASAHVAGADRLVRRDILDALALRVMLALRSGDHDGTRLAANALQALYNGKTTPDSAEEIGRYGLSEVIAGMAAADAGRSSDANAHYAAARRALAPLANHSTYWRILDP
ncbi:MAG TPA: toll/interleukin-1 receptor domain-containing protein, partial [Xanthomonadaceae bacterium]|nr:toll/interleukin-1 receptor domain-containing protein [Xanthomonadaceae bacterium]